LGLFFEDGFGHGLFEHLCALDLEGIVAKHRGGHYTSSPENTTWFKIRNRTYSLWEGRLQLKSSVLLLERCWQSSKSN